MSLDFLAPMPSELWLGREKKVRTHWREMARTRRRATFFLCAEEERRARRAGREQAKLAKTKELRSFQENISYGWSRARGAAGPAGA